MGKPVHEFPTSNAASERSDAQYSCRFYESALGEPPIAAAAILTITATLTREIGGIVLNGRLAQNVLNTNGGTLDSDGTFTLQLAAADNATAGAVENYEKHRLSLAATFTRTGGGVGNANHEITYFVRNMRALPTSLSAALTGVGATAAAGSFA